jgi:hypothetical protein
LQRAEIADEQGRRPTIIADVGSRLLLLLLHIQQQQNQAYPNPFVFALQVSCPEYFARIASCA